MSDGLDRDELISLLETLGSENDEEALAAARVLHGKVSAAGVTWDELLAVPSDEAEDGPEGREGASLDPAELGDLDKLPETVRAELTITLVERLEDVLAVALPTLEPDDDSD